MYILITPDNGSVPLAFQILVLNVVYAITSAIYERTFKRLDRLGPEPLHRWVQVSLNYPSIIEHKVNVISQSLLRAKKDSPLSASVLLALPAVCISW